MSIKVMTKVWEWSKADGPALLLMLAMADFCDDDGYCYPGIARIAKKCRSSERSTQRLIARLIEMGEIEREINEGLLVRGDRGPGHTNSYRITVGKIGGDTFGKGGDRNGVKGVTEMAEGGVIAMAPNTSDQSSVKTSAKLSNRKLDDAEFIEKLKTLPVYSGIDIDREIGKMQAWILAHPRKKLTQRFIINWLNNADRPVIINSQNKPAKPVSQMTREERHAYAFGK